MKRHALTALLAAILGAAAIAAPRDAEYSAPPPQPILSTDLSGSDLVFFTGAARQTALLVLLSGLGKAHAVTPEVQTVAAAIWKDQADAAARLKDLADKKHIPLDGDSDASARKQLQALASLKGVRFDKSCLDTIGDTQDLLETSLEAGSASTDKDIKAFADAGLGALKQERERVSRLGL
jgi:predicted outer membrane protein